ncbi:hypothetical protein crov405 [Cafeteria roenbergensis virus]|uniref:Uncharacterized protein n=1 Tax=Cafeteria roenbergensis virus (strain BV-PW1) TaxID=693272 RepID=E3T5H6_CROVB|nr:hypothetical protein crov405 [Cafeteria roenbergensis virus BV-PW1]ADO67439.1 hypothetical protein crov405 [Cafeteria roenbergensis virus BV-PW1]
MLFNYYLLEESISDFENKQNVCFYYSFYIYLKRYYPNLMSFKNFLNFKKCTNYFTSIQEFLEEFPLLYQHLLNNNINIKNILDQLVLGIATIENNKAKIISFIKLTSPNNYEYNKFIFKYNLNMDDKPIIILNQNEHFNPIMLKI